MDLSSRVKRKEFKIPEEIDIITEECKIIPEESPKVPEVYDKVKESKRECVSPIIPIDKDLNIASKHQGVRATAPKLKALSLLHDNKHPHVLP